MRRRVPLQIESESVKIIKNEHLPHTSNKTMVSENLFMLPMIPITNDLMKISGCYQSKSHRPHPTAKTKPHKRIDTN